jgi:hypothetical protein
MSFKIFTFTLMLMLFLSPAPSLLNAQDNETDTNSTIPLPTPKLNTILTVSTNSTSPEVNEKESMEEPVDPVILARIREQAQNRDQEMMFLFNNGAYPPEIMNGLNHAQDAMEKASHLEGNNTRAAAQQYLRAMKQYRNTLRKYLNDNPDFLTAFNEPQVNRTASDEVNGTVTEAEIRAARTQLINDFEERFQEQITAMIQNVEDVSDAMSPPYVLKAQQALTKAQQKLHRIQERILNGQYDEALDDLEDATSTLDEEFNNINDIGTSQMLRTMNQLEAKIQKIEQRTEKKALKGQNTAEEDALLAELRGNKNHIKNEYKQNKGNSNNNNSDGNPNNTGQTDKDNNKGKGNN